MLAAAPGRYGTRVTRVAAISMAVRIAMFPPEIAMT